MPALRIALNDPNAVVRCEVAVTLGNIGAEAGAAAYDLVGRLADPDEYVREAAAELCARLGPQAAPIVNSLVRAMADDELAELAISAIGNVGPRAKAAVPALIRALSGAQVPTRVTAKGGGGTLTFSEDDEEGLVEIAERALIRIGEPARAALEVERAQAKPGPAYVMASILQQLDVKAAALRKHPKRDGAKTHGKRHRIGQPF